MNQIKYDVGMARLCCAHMRTGEGHTIPEVSTKESVLLFKVTYYVKLKMEECFYLCHYHNFELQ